MHKLFGPTIIFGLSLWALQHTGPLAAENPDFLITAFLYLMLITSSLSFAVKLIALPFTRDDKRRR